MTDEWLEAALKEGLDADSWVIAGPLPKAKSKPKAKKKPGGASSSDSSSEQEPTEEQNLSRISHPVLNFDMCEPPSPDNVS